MRPREGEGLGNVESCSVYSTVKRTGPVERSKTLESWCTSWPVGWKPWRQTA